MRGFRGEIFVRIFGLALLSLFFGAQAVRAQQPACDVTWRKIDNPRVINGTVSIPAGQTVCVEPGVIVQFASDGKIQLFGRIIGTGISTDRIQFVGSNVFPNRVEILGTMELQFADISVPLNINPGGSLTCRDCSFTALGGVFTLPGLIFSYIPKFVLIENSMFDSNEETNSDNAGFYVSEITAVLRNVTFRNGAYCNISKASLYVDNVTSQNARFDGMELLQDSYQPQFLNNLSVTNAMDAGLHLLAGNFEIGPNVTLAGNEYPVRGPGGLLPASNVPASGNLNNWIEVGGLHPESIYAPFAIPYVANGALISRTEILPGVTIKARPTLKIESFGNGHGEVLGLPNAPITFEPFTPGQKWNGIEFHSNGDRMEYVVLDGSRQGVYGSDFAGTNYYFDNSVFRNHDIAVNRGTFDLYYMQGNLFTNNTIAVFANGESGTFRLSGETNPNLFENNGVAVRSQNGGNPDVRFNWWNSPTGPTTPLNPGGTGDIIEGPAQFQPFRTVRPDRTDHPPVVRLQRRPFVLTAGDFEGVIEPGQKVILRWDAFDNAQIVRQKILLSLNGNQKENFFVVADNLPGTQRSFEFTMPANAGTSGGFQKFIRIVAVDERGQEGWDEWQVQVPTGTEAGVLQITTPLAGQTFRPGQEFSLSWSVTTPFNNSDFRVFLILDGNRKAIFQANGGNTGPFSSIKIPFVSTDSARIAVQSQGAVNNVKWFYSEPFAIRPEARYPDAPPVVQMISPQAGLSFPTGGIVPITWTAADDEALRSFTILYSTDGGRTWLTLVENLPPMATNYNWLTPPGTGFPNVRVRVVAFDRRFQNSSDGANNSFSIMPKQISGLPALFDFDGDGASDISVYRNGAWYLLRSTEGFTSVQFGLATDRIVPADYDGDGKADVAVFRNGTWFIMNSMTNAVRSEQFGQSGDVPLPFDYDGDGRADLAVFRQGAWYILQSSNNSLRAEQFGQSGDVPAPADYDGDGKADLAVFRNGAWYLLRSESGFTAMQFGLSADVPVAGDYDGDAKADLAVFRQGNWYILQSTSGSVSAQSFGASADRPVPADYDGDAKTDVAVFRDGTWYLSRSTSGFAAVSFGQSGDVAVPAAFNP